MKRVKEACICQTLHFMLKEDTTYDHAVREEVEKYKVSLEKTKTKYKILEESAFT